ncbi:MAG: endonuclease/exonuclease/phosphatase family protein [Actinomycetota bacterium]|nr:endonuclease/exonuclease/phosphatase family protein [Actinomycetota bacterium]
MNMVLRVLTLNLWGDNPPLEERMTGLAAYLEAERPHVVALQEVADLEDGTQADSLAEAAGYPIVHHVDTGRLLWPGEGLAILSRLDAEAANTVALPHGPEDSHPRALQQLDVMTSGGTVIRVGNTHLAFRLDSTRLRRQQTERIREELEGLSGPVVLMGDLNDVTGSEPLRVLTDAGLVDCYAAVHEHECWTFHPANPFAEQQDLLERRVDHVLARGFEVSDAAVVLTGEDAPVVSDHFGLRATLRLATG